MNCRRCGEEFDEPLDGGCPGCGRKVAEAKPGARAARRPERTYSQEGGEWTWRLVALAAVAVLGCAGWFVYQKVTARPPAAAAEPAKKLLTLKDWRGTIKPAQLIPAMDALRALLDKADEKKPLELADALNRVVASANPTDARVMLLSALEGRKGRAAGGVLAVLCLRIVFYAHFGDKDDLALLQRLTIAAVLEHVDSADADARQGVAFCLRQLSGPHVTAEGRRIWEPDAAQTPAMRDACRRLLKDERPETRECAEKALENLK